MYIGSEYYLFLSMSDLDNKVVSHFSESDQYKSRKGIVHRQDRNIINFIKDFASGDPKILEVGGGSGALLALVHNEAKIEYLINCEIVPWTYKNQADASISLCGGSVLCLPFCAECFDIIIMKNVLHHLVGTSRAQSKYNAKKAIEEIRRVAKLNAYIIILEQYNEHSFFADIVFYICRILSLYGGSSRRFSISRNVIVSFLTPSEIKKYCLELELLCSDKERFKPNRLFKYTLLMGDIGHLFLILRNK